MQNTQTRTLTELRVMRLVRSPDPHPNPNQNPHPNPYPHSTPRKKMTGIQLAGVNCFKLIFLFNQDLLQTFFFEK